MTKSPPSQQRPSRCREYQKKELRRFHGKADDIARHPADALSKPAHEQQRQLDRQYERPRGILWDHLQPPQIREIPILERMGYA